MRLPALTLHRAAQSREAYAARRLLARAEPDEARRLAQRLAEAPAARPGGLLVWVHAGPGTRRADLVASVGLLEERRGARADILLTGDLADPPAHWHHVATPIDLPRIAGAFLDAWRPDAAICIGAVARPFLFEAVLARDIPLGVVEFDPQPGGLRADSPLLAPLARAAFVLAPRPLHFPGARLEFPGPLRVPPRPPSGHRAEQEALALRMTARPVWCAADIREGELATVTLAHKLAAHLAHRLLLILVPAAPGCGERLAADLDAAGWRCKRRALEEEPDPDTQIYIADTEGEIGLWFRLAPVSFFGGTLAPPPGGRDPYEAAALGSAVLHGPEIGAHREHYRALAEAGATRVVTDATRLGQEVEALLSPERAAAMAHAGWEIVTAGAAASDRALDLIEDLLDGVITNRDAA